MDLVCDILCSSSLTALSYNAAIEQAPLTLAVTRFPGEPVTVTIADRLAFRVTVPIHKDTTQTYIANRLMYLQASAATAPPKPELGIEARLVHGCLVPKSHGKKFWQLLPNSDLGQGASAKVFKVRNVSDGTYCAAKQFFRGFYEKEATIMSKLHHVSEIIFRDGRDGQLTD